MYFISMGLMAQVIDAPFKQATSVKYILSDELKEAKLKKVVVDYNETRPECNFGEVLSLDTVTFSDGAALNVDANYTGIAQFLNISIAENNGSEFARIDNDDTPDAFCPSL